MLGVLSRHTRDGSNADAAGGDTQTIVVDSSCRSSENIYRADVPPSASSSSSSTPTTTTTTYDKTTKFRLDNNNRDALTTAAIIESKEVIKIDEIDKKVKTTTTTTTTTYDGKRVSFGSVVAMPEAVVCDINNRKKSTCSSLSSSPQGGPKNDDVPEAVVCDVVNNRKKSTCWSLSSLPQGGGGPAANDDVPEDACNINDRKKSIYLSVSSLLPRGPKYDDVPEAVCKNSRSKWRTIGPYLATTPIKN